MTAPMTPNLDQERVERAAEAAYAVEYSIDDYPLSEQPDDVKELIRNIARAAITAYLGDTHVVVPREPTELKAAGESLPPQVGLNWQLSEETRKHLDEIERAIVRPGDPRLNQIICGSATPSVNGKGE